MKKIKIIALIITAIAVLGGAAAAGHYLWPQAATADKLSLDEQDATIEAIKKTVPAVVSIAVFNNETVLEVNASSTQKVQKEINKGQGTGFLISADGLILTNKHVVSAAPDGSAEYKIILNNKKEYIAKLIGKDPLNDLAVLKIDAVNLPYLELAGSAEAPVGLSVMAIGNSLGRYNNSVTKGIISGLGRTVTASDPTSGGLVSLDNVVQTDAEINEGNSGGPLINLQGKVVGINVAVDRGGAGLGFAIPSDDARSLVDSVRRTGRIIRVRLGVRYQMIDASLVAVDDLPRDSGALITADKIGPAVVPDSPAAKIGLREGDIIFEINAIKLDGANTLLSVIQHYRPGDRIGLKVQRGPRMFIETAVLDEFKTE